MKKKPLRIIIVKLSQSSQCYKQNHLGHLLSPVYFSPLRQERLFPVGVKGGQQAALSGCTTEWLKDGNGRITPSAKAKTTVPGMPKLLLWQYWVENVANVSPHTSIHLETVKSLINHPMDGLPGS